MKIFRIICIIVALALLFLSCTPTIRFASTNIGGKASYNGYTPNFVVTDSNMVMDCVRKYENSPYKWGGKEVNGVDCSGLVSAVYQECGQVVLPRRAEEQAEFGVAVERKYLRCGDLIFFRMSGDKVDHVAISLGNDIFVHASTSKGVRKDSLNDEHYAKRFAVAKRLFFE